jgi:hypothetical protein
VNLESAHSCACPDAMTTDNKTWVSAYNLQTREYANG